MKRFAVSAPLRRAQLPTHQLDLVSSWGRRFLIFIPTCWAASWVISFQTALLVLTLVAFVAAVAGLRRPGLGLIGMSMLCTLDAITRHLLLTTGGLWRWNSFNYWLLIVMLFSTPLMMNLPDLPSRILRAFVILLILELAMSPNLELGIQQSLGVATSFGLLVYFVRAREDDEAWYWLGLLNGTLGACGGLMYYLMQSRLPTINPNAWAFFPLTAIFAVCLSFPAALRHGWSVTPLAGLAMVNLTWVFLSGSRGDLLIALACMLFLIGATPGLARRAAYLAVAASLLVGISSAFPDLQQSSMHRLTKLFDSSETAAGRTSGRSDLGIGGYYIFIEHPLGVGTGGFAATWARLGNREGLSGFREGEEFAAHSGWIKILAENGLPGTLLLTIYIISFIIVGRHAHQPLLFGLAATVSVTLAVAFLSTEFQGKGFWFWSSGVTALLYRRSYAVQPITAKWAIRAA
jgi:hypothetical protein